jgi:hypothetical protein
MLMSLPPGGDEFVILTIDRESDLYNIQTFAKQCSRHNSRSANGMTCLSAWECFWWIMYPRWMHCSRADAAMYKHKQSENVLPHRRCYIDQRQLTE